jgi:mannose-6-phosphate isomerase-like protein (cupin superfamily)
MGRLFYSKWKDKMYICESQNRPQKTTNPDGEILQEILGIQAGGIQSHSLAEVTIPPGMSSSIHYHKHAEESYFIHSGEAEITIDRVPHTLKPGDAILIEPEEVHQILNRGSSDLVFSVVCVPAWRPGDFYTSATD